MPSSTRYRDLTGDIPSLVTDLTRGKITAKDKCHLDPDLDTAIQPRRTGWRGSLGQVSAAQSHLDNHCVGPGDLFLFWGLYRSVEKNGQWTFTGQKEHRIFGWLQVDAVVNIGTDPKPALQQYLWLAGHPHVRKGWSEPNTVYVAKKHLKLDGQRLKTPGWGLFDTGRRLTRAGSRLPSVWAVPAWLNPRQGGVGMTYHPEQRWSEDGQLKSAARGQEFITDVGDRNDALAWIHELFEETK